MDERTHFIPEQSDQASHSIRKIERDYDELAVYRCETGKYGQVYLYFVGTNEAGLSKLLTLSTET